MRLNPLIAPPADGTLPRKGDLSDNYEIFDGGTGLRVSISTTGTAQYELWHSGSDGRWMKKDECPLLQVFGGGDIDVDLTVAQHGLVLGQRFCLVGVPGMLAADACYVTSSGAVVDVTGLQY